VTAGLVILKVLDERAGGQLSERTLRESLLADECYTAPLAGLAEGIAHMDTTIIVAIIAAIGAIAAAVLPMLLKKRKEENQPSSTVQVGNVQAGHDVIVTSGDATVIQQQYLEQRFMSHEGARLVIDVSKKVIRDEGLRQTWSSFDAKFLYKCIKDTPRGMVFDGEAIQEFRKTENNKLFGLGVEVYTACCKAINDENNEDYKAFNRIAQIYLSARMVLRQQS